MAIYRRKFRSQTSDNMDRWKAEIGRVREEKRREEERRSRRESPRRKKIQVREKVGKSRNTVFFQWFVAPEGRKVGSLKRRVRSHLARWEMNNWHYATLHHTSPHHTLNYTTLHYPTPHCISLHYIALHSLHHRKCNCNCTTLITLHHTTTPLHYNNNYSCTTPHYIQQLWVRWPTRWPLQPLQPLQKTQLQPPFGPSVDSLCHPWFTTTNLSYRFPIFETSATALCGTAGSWFTHWKLWFSIVM